MAIHVIEEDGDDWEVSDRVFTDLTLALRFVKESIELYEARDETKQIDSKLKKY